MILFLICLLVHIARTLSISSRAFIQVASVQTNCHANKLFYKANVIRWFAIWTMHYAIRNIAFLDMRVTLAV